MRRKRIWISAACLLVIGAGVTLYFFNNAPRELVEQRQHIETKYNRLLGLIEKRAADALVDLSDFGGKNGLDLLALEYEERALHEDIKAAIPHDRVYRAFWTPDGRVIGRLDSHEGNNKYRMKLKPVSWSIDRLHSLREGSSPEGDELLVFNGRTSWFNKRGYTIIFYKRKILDDMEVTANESAQSGPRD
jgi:hypothetical protein